MAKTPDFRDYLYVSQRSVERLAGVLPPKVLSRLNELNFNVGPVGAGFVLDKRAHDGFLAALVEVEDAIRTNHVVKRHDDPTLRPGNWFEAQELESAYGVPDYGDEPTNAAVFVSEEQDQRVFLCGSAVNLLDRSLPAVDVTRSMSHPEAIIDLLALFMSPIPNVPGSDATPIVSARWSTETFPIIQLHELLSWAGTFPLSFLGRALRVSVAEDGIRNVIGSPLFVALDVPD